MALHLDGCVHSLAYMNRIISEVSIRIEVTSLADALPTYRTLAGTDDVHRFQFPEFALAVVGPFMPLVPPHREQVGGRDAGRDDPGLVCADPGVFLHHAGHTHRNHR